MKARTCLFLAGLAGASGVAAGAIVAHHGAVDAAGPLHTAVRYHMYHALALLGVAAIAARAPGESRMLSVSAWCFVAGIVLFSGGIYLMAALGPLAFNFAAPLGGLAFIAGWLALAGHALRKE
ncbi:MAG TPA: DUF423 domain-containing protein [Alphaproteobacteria bacterium]|nr:DUF423 domain-containing protein [Alphaproteobacteria bacterium]